MHKITNLIASLRILLLIVLKKIHQKNSSPSSTFSPLFSSRRDIEITLMLGTLPTFSFFPKKKKKLADCKEKRKNSVQDRGKSCPLSDPAIYTLDIHVATECCMAIT